MKMNKKRARREAPRRRPEFIMQHCQRCKRITQHVKISEYISPITPQLTEYYCCEICR